MVLAFTLLNYGVSTSSNPFPIPCQHFFISMTKSIIIIETKNFLVMCWRCQCKPTQNITQLDITLDYKERMQFTTMYLIYHLRIQNRNQVILIKGRQCFSNDRYSLFIWILLMPNVMQASSLEWPCLHLQKR
jgi:hypothetical protein